MEVIHKVVSWNLNSIKSRLGLLLKLIEEQDPDIILLQELKCIEESFPALHLSKYNIAIHGQKTYNGVAILSKSPIEDINKNLNGFEDAQARYVECVTMLGKQCVRVASVYVPNGQSIDSDKFLYKLKFLEALKQHLSNFREESMIVGGDYNVAPEEIDVYDAVSSYNKICFHIEERKLIRSIINGGFYDIFRTKYPTSQEFTWWDYRARNFNLNKGLRIDHILTSPSATDFVKDIRILKEYRDTESPSDHAPLLISLNYF